MSRRSLLGWLDLVLPADRLIGKITRDISFGVHPRQRLDIYCPVAGDGPAPAVFFVYGGGWNSGTKHEYGFVGRAFAAAGFVTVIADYRLVPEVHFPTFLEDAGAALKWVDQHVDAFGGTAESLFLMGHSAGAYNAVMMGLDAQRFGGPDLAGRLKGVVGLSGPYDFYPFDVRESIEAFSRTAAPEMTQPVNLVHADMAPLLLLHGAKDKTCLPRNSRALAARAHEMGAAVETKFYPNMDHAWVLLALFRPLRWQAPVFEHVVQFMRAQLAL